jgi:putative redox protein
MPQVNVVLHQAGKTTSHGTARTHEVFVDRPEAKGGSDRGPMGGEYMLLGIGGCFASNLYAAAIARELPLNDLVVQVSAEVADTPSRFASIALTVSSSLERDEFEKLVTIADRSCISVNTVRSAVDLTVDIGSVATTP